MPRQLIYTSAPRTLVAGQSGYGTVARSIDLRESLAQRLEQLSYYTHLPVGNAGSTCQPRIFAYRIVDFRGSRYHVLTRIEDAGLDFTNRTNHLAHHLVFEPAELKQLPPPTVIFGQWNGWRKQWLEEPSLLNEGDWGNLLELPHGVPLPAVTWQEITGDAGSAAGLFERPLATGCTLTYPAAAEGNVLDLFAESLQLLDPSGRQPVKLWDYTFTTFLQSQDNPLDFRWRGSLEEQPSWQSGQRAGSTATLISISEITVPSNRLATLAREGPAKPASTAKGGARTFVLEPSETPGSLRLESHPPTPRPLRSYQSAESESPQYSNAPSASRRITLDLASRRFWTASVIILCVIGVLLFEFRKRKSSPAGSLSARTNSLARARSVGVENKPTGQPSKVEPPPQVSPGPSAQALPTAKAETPRVTQEALAQLAAQTDAVPTWLVPLDEMGTAALPEIKELNLLLRQIFLVDRPLSTAAIPCRLGSRQIDCSTKTGTNVEVEEQHDPKGIAAHLPSGEGFQLDCNSWLADKGVGRGAILSGQNVKQTGGLVISFERTDSVVKFPGLRLIVLASLQFEPIKLSKTLLNPGATDFQGLFHPQFYQWLRLLRVADAKAKWQLRTSTRDSAKADLNDSLAEAFQTGPEQPLNFESIRERIHVPLDRDQQKLAALTKSIDELQASIQDDLRLGEILFHKTNDLASLVSFAKARNYKVDRPTYLGYLRELLATQEPNLVSRVPTPSMGEDEARGALTRLAEFIEQNPRLAARLKRLPGGYFESRWDALGRAPELIRKAAELESTRRSIGRYEGYLNKVPADLASTPRVSLVLSSSTGMRHEIVRFEDPSFLPARPTP